MKRLKIAIDGPAASGKSTIAKEVARRLSYLYIDTGAMYRAVTWKAARLSSDFKDEKEITEIAERNPVSLEPDSAHPCGYRVFVDNQDITGELSNDVVNRFVSPVAKISGVRRILVARQKALAESGGVVMAGRDITTVVLPDAEIKIYLTASPDERVRRRHQEMLEKGGESKVSEVKEIIELRDHIDSTREDSPLSIAPDASVIDSSTKSIEEVVDEVMRIVSKHIENQS